MRACVRACMHACVCVCVCVCMCACACACCKRYLGVPSRTPNKMVYEELGRYPPLLSHTFVMSSQYVACICTDPLPAYLILIECLPTYCNNAIEE